MAAVIKPGRDAVEACLKRSVGHKRGWTGPKRLGFASALQSARSQD